MIGIGHLSGVLLLSCRPLALYRDGPTYGYRHPALRPLQGTITGRPPINTASLDPPSSSNVAVVPFSFLEGLMLGVMVSPTRTIGGRHRLVLWEGVRSFCACVVRLLLDSHAHSISWRDEGVTVSSWMRVGVPSQ
jgi:hypothetical protein